MQRSAFKWCGGGAVLWGCFLIGSVSAQDKPKPQKLAALDIADVDADYVYQGEYMGHVAERAGSPYVKKIGVQVSARGKGTFDVTVLEGGLPGDGWDNENRAMFPAQLDSGSLQLQAGARFLTIGDNLVIVQDEQRRELGRLRKYARRSPTIGRQAPQEALVLFDGQPNDLWKNMNVTPDGLLEEGCETVDLFQDFHIHLEFLLPYKPEGRGQDRGNSGLYLQRRYEVQVLDSFGEEPAKNGCASIYTIFPPDLNMNLPPMTWQTYDIDFKTARFDDEGNKIEDMKIRVLLNGVVVHDGIEVPSKTGAGRPEGPQPMPILLQNHSNPVRYRNIWLVEGNPFERDTLNTAELTRPKQPAAPCATAIAGGPAFGGYPAVGHPHRAGWPALGSGYEYRTWHHNYGYDPARPLPYWYSSSFVDLPPYPYYGFRRW